MRRSQLSFLLTIGTTLLLLIGLLGGWALATWQQQGSPTDRTWLIGLGGLTVGLVLTLAWFYRFTQLYFFHMKALGRDAALILQSNPHHRLTPTGPRDLRTLSTLLNQYADRFQGLLADRDAQVQQARADLEEERNLLATLMADLSDGVVVCNHDGRILLYNARARQLLATAPDVEPREPGRATGGYVGLGRSIFGLLDRNALTYGLAHVEKRSRTATAFAPPIATSFITTATNGALLRAQMTPLPATAGERRGFVLLLHDMTQRVAADSRRDLLLQGLTERMRGGLGNMRAALELLEQFPTMPPTQRQRFQRVLDEEAAALSRELDQVARDFAADLRGQWHFEAISGNDLLWAVEHQLAAQEGVQIQTGFGTETGIAPLWVRIDSYAVVHGLATAVRLLRDEFQRTAFTVRLQPFYPLVAQASAPPDPARQCRFAALDVYWSSQGIATAAWLAWQERFTTADAGDTTLTLRTVAAQHGSEVWFQHEQATAQSYFRLLLPLAAMPPTFPQPATVAPVIESRPQYYDFDLFGQTTQNSPLHEQTLDQLTYTVFDTETTGLDPQRDEIVAIGAVRVLNGRLLRQEIFDQLVDPQRPIPRLATEIHGIADSMVQGQPLIAAVLPRFARFAEETVLVGHNLAFDLRMFEVKADVAGVHFAQPRLDTLLLSEIIRPDAEDHALEAIAARLGINVLGRHTALGDAFVTAEIFLRLLPLLNAQGIFTLADALTASKATYLARLQY